MADAVIVLTAVKVVSGLSFNIVKIARYSPVFIGVTLFVAVTVATLRVVSFDHTSSYIDWIISSVSSSAGESPLSMSSLEVESAAPEALANVEVSISVSFVEAEPAAMTSLAGTELSTAVQLVAVALPAAALFSTADSAVGIADIRPLTRLDQY